MKVRVAGWRRLRTRSSVEEGLEKRILRGVSGREQLADLGFANTTGVKRDRGRRFGFRR